MDFSLTIQKKLYLGFIIVALLSAGVAGIGYTQIDTVNKGLEHLVTELYVVKDACDEMEITMLNTAEAASEYVAYSYGGSEAEDEYHEKVDAFHALAETARAISKDLGHQDMIDYGENIRVLHKVMQERGKTMMATYDAAAEKYPGDMTAIMAEVDPYMEAFDEAVVNLESNIEDLETANDALIVAAEANADDVVAFATTLMAGGAIVAVIAGLGLGVFISRGIANPLSALGLDAGEIASGNLDHDWTVKDRTDEIGEVITAIKTMVGSMKNTLNDVEVAQKAAANRAEEITNVVKIATEVSTSINDLSGKVLNSAKIVGEAGIDLASQAQNLSASMQQVQGASNNVSEGSQNLSQLAQKTVTNIDSLSRVFNQVNQNAENMSNLVKQSNALAQQVGENGNSALSSLGDIKSTNSEMGEIIGQVNSSVVNVAGLANDISDIADQVNMLALNAAVEAARAGEAGRGFAVVADAVKQLAGQTVSTARTAIESIDEITRAGEKANDMAKQSGEAAEKGNEVISQGVQGTLEVVSAIEDIQKMTESLTSLVAEGVKAIEEVSGAIQQVASFSEEAASASEESASSIEEQTASTEQVASTSQTVQEEGQRAVTLAEDIVKQVERLTEVLSQVQV